MEKESESQFLQMAKEKQDENSKERRQKNKTRRMPSHLLRLSGLLVEVGQRILPIFLALARGVSEGDIGGSTASVYLHPTPILREAAGEQESGAQKFGKEEAR